MKKKHWLWAAYFAFLVFSIVVIIQDIVLRARVAELMATNGGEWGWDMINSNPDSPLSIAKMQLWNINEAMVYSGYTHVMVTLIYLYRKWDFIKDKIRKRRYTAFEDLSIEAQRAQLGKMFCKNCGEYHSTLFQREDVVQSIPVLYVKCNQCREEIRIRRED